MITVNYGTGSTNEAAAWVAYVNAATNNPQSLGVDAIGTNWHTAGYWASLRAAAPLATDDGQNFLRISQPAPLGFKYWEIGNEMYGYWETDNNYVPHDPYTYAKRSQEYISLMKSVDPTIKIGVVVLPGTGSYVVNTDHPATDPRTQQTSLAGRPWCWRLWRVWMSRPTLPLPIGTPRLRALRATRICWAARKHGSPMRRTSGAK